MNKALVVAKWEYLEKVKSKAFLIGLFLTPIIMVGMGILPTLFATQEEETTKVIGVIAESNDLVEPFRTKMIEGYKFENGIPRYLIEEIAVGPAVDVDGAIAEGDARVLAEKMEGYCVYYPSVLGDSVVEYHSRNVGDFNTARRIEGTFRSIVREKKALSLGFELSRLKQLDFPFDLQTINVSKDKKGGRSGFLQVFFTSYVFMMMLFFLILSSGQLLVRSVVEEKSNRIVEILVSSCSPTELMAGKVLGLSGLGFTQIAFWAIIGVVVTAKFDMTIIPIDHALLLIVYFVLGYLLYAAIFIGMGSPVTTEQEAQQLTSYLVLILIIPLVIAMPAIQNPNATWIKVLTFVPLLTPTMMALRIPIQMPSTIEIVGTIMLLLVSIYASMWVAGRIFRVAILATGKRPTLAEIGRWIKTG